MNLKTPNTLEINNLKKVYPNGFQAIFDINLKIAKGEFVVFVGPSGCGKSTMLRMISGLERATSGSIILNNKNATDLPPRKRNLAMVFQNYALFPHLTVKENIAFGLKVKRLPREVIEKKIIWAANVLNLKYLLNRKPMQLSGGQRQRVALGRAIVLEPDLFLMDEPLSNLDAKLRGKMKTVIRKLHDKLKTTSIYVTHDQIEAMTMADKIVVMSDGFVQQVGTPEEVFQKPANKFVASFIGTPTMNFIEGKIEGKSFISEKINVDITSIKFVSKLLKRVTLGIRPQYLKKADKAGLNTTTSNVNFIEMHGAQTIVHLDNGFKYVCKTEDKPTKNQEIHVKINIDKAIFFHSKENGIALNYEINEETKQSLQTLNDSFDLIKKRTDILEKHKNKNVNTGLYQKISRKFIELIFCEYIILNPELFELKAKKRLIKENAKDAKRRQDHKKVDKLIFKLKQVKIEIKNVKKELRGIQRDVILFKKNAHKIKNKLNLFENVDIQFENIDKFKSIYKDIKIIKLKFEKKNLYNKEELLNINKKILILLKDN